MGWKYKEREGREEAGSGKTDSKIAKTYLKQEIYRNIQYKTNDRGTDMGAEVCNKYLSLKLLL